MYVVTGAGGHLGRLTVEELLRTVPAEQIVAAVRTPAKVADLAERGVVVREADHDRPETLEPAFDGAQKVLLVSGSVPGQRLSQHTAVVDAAARAGVRLLAYTSVLHADTVDLAVTPDHRATEGYIRGAGVPFSFLRNGWYHENYEQTVRQAAETGTFVGSAGDGRLASATRADYAAAAAAVLTGDGHEDSVYELTGDTAWTRSELAAVIASVTGRQVTYTDLTPEEYTKVLIGAGLPEGVAGFVAAIDVDVAAGGLADTPGTLSKLIGRPTTPLRAWVATALG